MKFRAFSSSFALAILSAVLPAQAQVCQDFSAFFDPPNGFGDSPSTVVAEITFPSFTVTDVNVTLNVNHTFVGDVVMTLSTPDGDSATLVSRAGGADDNFIGTVFDDEASAPIASGSAPFTGSFIPLQPLSNLDGFQSGGAWILTVTDEAPSNDNGALVSVTLSVCGTAACAPGQEPNELECSDCGPGTYSFRGVACDPCEADRVAPGPNATICTSCGDGQISNESSTACVPCAAGKFEEDSGGSCVSCPPGSIAPEPGASECQQCPPGTVSNGARTACVQDVSALDCTTVDSTGLPAEIFSNGSLLVGLGVTSDVRLADLDVTLRISHGSIGNLDIALISPQGTTVRLVSQVGGDGTGFDGTTFDDEADAPISEGTPPYSGLRYRPEDSLSAFDGEDARGIWFLSLEDRVGGPSGMVEGWSLTLCTACVNVPNDDPPLPFGSGTPVVLSTVQVDDTFDVGDVDVTVSLVHDYLQDVELRLISPSGTSVLLNDSLAPNGGALDALRFDDEALLPISFSGSQTSLTGSYIPENPLSAFDGQPANGVWTLSATDTFPEEDDGTLQAWSLEVCPAEEAAATCPSNPPYAIGDEALLEVIDGNPFCCDGAWEPSCQIAYHLFSRACTESNFNQTPQPWSSGPGESASVTSEIVFEGAYTLEDLTVFLEIDSPDVTYLTITLNAPNGVGIVLYDQTVSGPGFIGTGFADDAVTEIGAGSTPYTGIFQPAQPLSVLEGAPLAGTWSLTIEETDGFGAGTSGTLKFWGLCANTNGCFAASPYPVDDPLFQDVIIEDFTCCSTEWTPDCQQKYDVRLACQTRSANLLTNGGFESSTNNWLDLPPGNSGVFVQTTRSDEGVAALGFERGGIVGPQTGSIRQTVTIPSAIAAGLDFSLLRDTLGPNTTGSLDVFVDGNLLDSVDQSSIPGAFFNNRSIDLTDYADGSEHTVVFSFSVSSGTGASSIIYLDAANLTVCTGPAEGEGEGLVEGVVEGEGEGVREGEGEGVVEGEGEGVREGEGEGVVEGEGEGVREGEGEGVAEGEGEGVREGEGEGQSKNAYELLLYTFASADSDGNSLVTLAEILVQLPEFTEQDFDAADANGDGFLSVAELLELSTAQVVLSADTSGDYVVSLSELLRAVQLYNAGGYACAANAGATEDGYLPSATPGLPACVLHGLDQDGDNQISLSELLRGIQLFSFAGYTYCDGQSEDDFCDRL